ncbi:MAG: hypothetical protein ABIH66_08550, partial [bacterium]
MCSLYSPAGHAMCACFLGKGDGTVAALKRLQSEYLLWSGLGSGVVSLHDLEREISGRRAWDPGGPDDRSFIAACEKAGIKVFGVVFTQQGYEVAVEIDREGEKLYSFTEKASRENPLLKRGFSRTLSPKTLVSESRDSQWDVSFGRAKRREESFLKGGAGGN